MINLLPKPTGREHRSDSSVFPEGFDSSDFDHIHNHLLPSASKRLILLERILLALWLPCEAGSASTIRQAFDIWMDHRGDASGSRTLLRIAGYKMCQRIHWAFAFHGLGGLLAIAEKRT